MSAVRMLVLVMLVAMALPAQQARWQLSGPFNHHYRLLAPFSDYNGDGIRDVLFQVFPNSPLSNVLEVRILSGSDGSILWQLPMFANNMASVGDMDGDGSPDLVVQWPYAIGPVWPIPAKNAIQVWSPKRNQMLWQVFGNFNANFGYAMLGDLDTDGDGFPNLVTLSWSGPESDVYVYNNRGLLQYKLPMAAFNREAISLAGMGDMDGDGCDDFIIGISEPTARGEVRLISGRTGATLRSSYGIAPGELTFQFATNVGDLDGDGVNDYAAFPWWSAFQLRIVIWSGATGAVLRTFADYAESVIACEDLDLDGVNDLVLGSEYWVQPNVYGRTIALSGRDGTELWRIENFLGSWQPSSGWGRFAASLGVQPGSPYPVVSWLDIMYKNLTLPLGGAQGRVRAFGGAYAGQGPVVGTPCSSTSHVPQIGTRNTATGSRITIAKAEPGAFAWLNLMVGNPASYGGVALPMSLDTIGFPGCMLHVAPEISFLRMLGTTGIDRGYAAVDLNWHLAAAQGYVLQAQWLTFDPPSLAYSATARHAIQLQ
jgi:hypothetical protein